MSFVIFALPRSRTAWLARFLTYADWQCGHDELRHCRSLADVTSWFAQPCTGTVETGAAPFWRLVPPGVRVATIRRPLDQVAESLRRAGGLALDQATIMRHLQQLDRKLDQVEARLPGVMRLEYDELATEAGCALLFTFCTQLPHDSAWWEYMAPANVQVSVPHLLRYARAYAPQIEKLRRIARHEMLRRLRQPAEPIPGVTFQQESLHQAFTDPDGRRLMSDECVAMGEDPGAWRQMNIPLLQRIEDMGNLHIFTARSNGRMFGYLVTACGEAFHALDEWEADQVSFYADPAWPGLGRMLQRAAIDDLQSRGVKRVLMFQPDETRVGLVYRRLGAKQTGQRYVLELN